MRKLLDRRQRKAIALLIENQYKKTEIADMVGVSRQTIYDWMKNKEFAAELDKTLQQIKIFGENSIKANLQQHINQIQKLAATAESEKTRLEAATYLVDRVLGKTTSKIDLTAEAKQTVEENSEDILKSFENIRHKEYNEDNDIDVIDVIDVEDNNEVIDIEEEEK